MKIGLCTSLSNLELPQRLGYDYIESHGVELHQMSTEEFAQAKEQVEAGSIQVECVCILFPRDYPFYTVSPQDLSLYAELVYSRAAALGAKISVFGSGNCRKKPADLSFSQAVEILVKNIRVLAEVGQAYGISIAVEPLNYEETDMINTLAEAKLIAQLVDRPNVGIIADGYHMMKIGEPMEHIGTVGAPLHTHIALKEGRGFPVKETPELTSFVQQLQGVSYQGRMSIEGSSETLEKDAAAALTVLRQMVE